MGLSHLHKILCNSGYCFKSSSLLCAVGLYNYKLSRSAMFTSNYGTGSPSFYCLSNLEFDSLIHLGNWFNCLLLLIRISSKI